MANCKPKDAPTAKGQSLIINVGPKIPQEKERIVRIPYANAIGSLMYAIMCTRLYISYVVGLVSKYYSNPDQKH